MNSMPQQAVANGKGQRAFFRAQAATASTRVVTKSARPPPAFAENAGSALDSPSPLILPPAGILTSSAEVDRVGERLHVAHAVEVDEAVQVIDLVLEDARMVPGGFELDLRARTVDGLDPDRGKARHDAAPEKRHGETALGVLVHLRADPLVEGVEEARQGNRRLLLLAALRVHLVEENPQRREDLRRRDAGAFVLAHRVLEVREKRLVVAARDGVG